MITIAQYFSGKPHSAAQEDCARDLLDRCQRLIDEAEAAGAFVSQLDPDTGTGISGSKGGAGDGGFRLPTASTGKRRSSHKEAKAVDVYDPGNKLDNWLTDSELEKHDLYREHPDSTPGWCHLSTRAPGSGRRTFYP